MSARSFALPGLLALALAGPLSSCASRTICCGTRAAPAGMAPASLPPAPASVTLHVLVLKAYVYREPQRDPKTQPFVSLPIGAPVSVAPESIAGKAGGPFRRIVQGEGSGGFVPEEELQASAPSAPETLERARTLLGEGALDEAVTWAERSAALDASSREAWDLLAAIHDARGDVGRAVPVYAQRAKLPALPAPAEEEARGPAPAVGQPRFISATKLRVRAKPSRKAKILAELALNTRVEVLGVQGEFTKVAWMAEARDVWIVHLGGPPTEGTQAAARQVGYVGTAYLAPQPATREELLTRADAAEPQGRLVETARALERAVLLAPHEQPLVQRLTRVAARARLYPLAALTARQLEILATTPDPQVGTDVTLELFFGCTGAPPVNAEEACTPVIDTLGLCEPNRPLSAAGDAEMSGVQLPDEEIAAVDARRQAAYDQERAEYDAYKAGFDKSLAEARALYPSGPWVHARIPGSRELHAAGKRVFVYSLDFNIGSECSQVSGQALLYSLKFAPRPRSWPDEGETLEVWVKDEGYENTLHGVVAARTEADARALVTLDVDPDSVKSPAQLAPEPQVAGPWRLCDSCSGC